MVGFAAARAAMVRTQLRARGVADARVLRAMGEVPRERFVPDDLRPFAYDDRPLPIAGGQTISQPLVVALMLEALMPRADDKALEVGAGSGYAAVVLGRLVREVIAVELLPELVQGARAVVTSLGVNNVRIEQGDGSVGWAAEAPFDAILVSAGAPAAPASLLAQLAEGGRMVIPVGHTPRAQRLLRIRRTGPASFARDDLGGVYFVPLLGEEGWSDAQAG